MVDELDLGMGDPHHEDHLPDRLGEILVADGRLRHAGEGRELVDHALDVVDLPHDRVRALVEHLAIRGDDLAVFAADALGRELDRGQRVLDLVRDAPRHVGPGGGALRRDEIGDVVERDRRDPAPRLRACSLVTRTLMVRSLPLRVIWICCCIRRWRAWLISSTSGATSGSTMAIGLAEQVLARRSPSRASVEGLTMVIEPAGIDADHAGRDAGQNRFGEAAAAVHQVAGGGQAVVLAAQLRGHLVEGLAQMAEIALAPAHGHLDIEVAGRDLVGGVDQPPDRARRAGWRSSGRTRWRRAGRSGRSG